MDALIKKQMIEEDVDISERVQVEGKVWIRRGTKIFEGACIRGPCYIGSNSLIGNNCLVRNYSSIGNDCVVGFSSEIKNSLIGNNCWFHMNYVGDSIISDNCLFGAGATTANFRFDEKNVRLRIEGKTVDSGRDKLGIIVGDNCKTGINASLSPGIKVGPYSVVGPGVYLQSDLEPGRIIFLDKRSYVVKENKITIPFEKRQKLMESLLKYEER
ncbi:hypothetical protein KAU85_02355, partial [Candidatus Bathyarchaeota archaeon]|nr:hypothetical protein [Candidatus Bathyarchaeota archaeon]